ncbi:MAG: hypothetical protein PHD65_07400 [Gallionella sp.]|nr:hypothetical protein [Gallionella sp.]
MISTELSNTGLPDNLPLLTQVVETDAPDDLPTLTEVVADAADIAADTANTVAGTPDVADTPDTVADTEDRQPAILAAQENGIDTATAEPDGESQPITSREAIAHETASSETVAPEAAAPPPRALSEAELQQILQHLEAHLDTMLASKLSLHFEKLRDALNAHLDSKIP